MAVATIESAFHLVDRASPQIRGIRRELRGLQRDAEKAGVALDGVSDEKRAKRLEDLVGRTHELSAEENRLRGSTRGLQDDLSRLEQQEARNTRRTREHRLEVDKLGGAMRLLRWPALIAGAGGATQVLGGLAAGAVELIPKLTDVAGGGAAVGTTMFGAGEAMGVAKLATHGLSEALAGNQKALHDLTPEGRAFLQVLRDARPEVRDLQRTAQDGLFPGAADLIGGLRVEEPQLRRIVGQVSGDLGGLARFAGRQIESPGFMRDLVTLSDQSSRALGAAARSGFYFAHAIEEILLAGGPFTDWLGNTVEGWAKTAENEAEVARQTGELERYFDRTKHTLELLIDVGDHVFGGIGGLLRAARGDSDDLWTSIDRDARRWDEWSNSFRGQNEMRRWFDDARPVLHETAVLFGDIATAVGHLAQGPEGAAMLHELDAVVPDLAQGIGTITTNFGPAAVDAIASGVHLLGDMGDTAGPLTLMARAVGLSADAVDRLVRSLGPLGPAVAQLGVTALVLKRVGLLGALTGRGGGTGGSVGLLGSVGVGMAAGGRSAAAARGLSATEGALLGGGAVVAGGRLARLRALPGDVRAGGALVGETYAASRAAGVGRVGALRAALAGGGELTGATDLLAAGGRVVWPLALASGVLGALGTQGDALTKVQGGASAATLGIVPRPVTDEEKRSAGGAFASNLISGLSQRGSLAAQRRTIGQLRQTIGTLPGNDALNQNQADLRAATKMLKNELDRREALLRDSERRVRQHLEAQSVQHGQALVTDFTHAFEIRSKGPDGPAAAMHRTIDGVLREQGRMRTAGAKVLDESMLAWVRQQAKNNPKLLGEVARLRSGIEDSFSRLGKHVEIVDGQILTGSRSEWQDIRTAMSTQTEKAREEVSSDFTAIQQQAVGSLEAMGFPAGQARSMVRNLEAGGAGARAARGAAATVAGGGRQNLPAAQQVLSGPRRLGAAGDGLGIGDGVGASSTSLTIHGGPVTHRFSDNRSSVNFSSRTYLSGSGPVVFSSPSAPTSGPRPIYIHMPVTIPGISDKQAERLVARYVERMGDKMARDLQELFDTAAEEAEVVE